jgi:hypothetical protein
MCAAKQPWPGANAALAPIISGKLGYDLIVSGDNHQQFVKGNIVNPGSLMRMSSDQADFEPAVFGFRRSDSAYPDVTRIPLPIEKDAVKATARPAEEKASRDERMEAYITRARRQFEDRLSFEKNLESHFKTNKERAGVKTITWKAVGHEAN